MNEATAEALADADTAIVNSQALWGAHLVRLVPPDLAKRWAVQWKAFNDAIADNDEGAIVAHAGAVVRGLGVLDATAREAGHKPPDRLRCQLTTPAGVRVGIVADGFDRSKVEGFDGCLLTFAEVGKMLDDCGAEQIENIKHIWPGATVKDVNRLKAEEARKEELRKKGIDPDLNDEIPF